MRHPRRNPLLAAAVGLVFVAVAALVGVPGPTTAGAASTPAAVDTPVAKVSAGGTTTCAVTVAGKLLCWGGNANGQVGIGTFGVDIYWATAVDLPGGALATDVAVGEKHACAASDSGTKLWCWGSNASGQLGLGTVGDFVTSPIEVPLPTGTHIAAISAGWDNTCIVDGVGDVWCWGANAAGQLGRGNTGDPQATPGKVVGLPHPADIISTGTNFTCAGLPSDGSIWCWGDNGQYQLGQYNTTAAPPGQPIVAQTTAGTFTSIASRGNSTCAVGNAGGGTLVCWGWWTTVHANGPSTVNTGFATAAVANGDNLFCAASTTGDLKCGPYASSLAPLATGGSAVKTLTAGNGQTCFVATDGLLQCWGPGETSGQHQYHFVPSTPQPIDLGGQPALAVPTIAPDPVASGSEVAVAGTGCVQGSVSVSTPTRADKAQTIGSNTGDWHGTTRFLATPALSAGQYPLQATCKIFDTSQATGPALFFSNYPDATIDVSASGRFLPVEPTTTGGTSTTTDGTNTTIYETTPAYAG